MEYNRSIFLEALQKQLEPSILSHSLAVEACMNGIYEYLKQEQKLTPSDPPKSEWLLAGLIHDIDYGGEFKQEHPFKLKEVLAKYNLTVSSTVESIIHAHAAKHFHVTPQNKAEWAIYCADSLTGLIAAVAYVYPSRKLADVKVSSVIKRLLHQPKFAAGTRRDEIAECGKKDGLDIPIEKFVEICLTSMQSIAPSIGL